MTVIKQGSRGEEVRSVQDRLKKLGFTIDADAIFGEKTHAAVVTLQTIFGYDTDGMVGPATLKLLDQQVGYGWSLMAARKAYDKPAT